MTTRSMSFVTSLRKVLECLTETSTVMSPVHAGSDPLFSEAPAASACI